METFSINFLLCIHLEKCRDLILITIRSSKHDILSGMGEKKIADVLKKEPFCVFHFRERIKGIFSDFPNYTTREMCGDRQAA